MGCAPPRERELTPAVSSHPDDIPLATMPSWLHELILVGATKSNTGSDSAIRIAQGSRNNALTSLAGTMRGRGMSHEAIEAALQKENQLRCDPPLGEDEVRKIALSISQYPANPSTPPPSRLIRERVTTSVALDCPPNIEAVRQTVQTHFPHLWPAVDLGLATCATLLLADNANPAAVIFVGPPAAGKTTVATMFADASICYRSDKFTPAAFVSHSAKASKKAISSAAAHSVQGAQHA